MTSQHRSCALLKKYPPSLAALIDEGIIDGVTAQLLSGKEASIYIAERDGAPLAAKVYKSRNERTFKNVAAYVDGRNRTRNTRDQRAQRKKTNYGRELMEADWRSMEHDALHRAFYAGVRVPEPYLLVDDVLLMELLVDEHGDTAPRLADIDVPHNVAALLHQEVFQQVRALLSCGLIHGDLSAYNILLADNGLNLIDMPQAVDAAANSDAKEILRRDLANVTEHLARFDARLLKFVDCGELLFRHYEKGTLDGATAPEERVNLRGGRRRRGRPPREGRRNGSGSERASQGATPKGGTGPRNAPKKKRGPDVTTKPTSRPAPTGDKNASATDARSDSPPRKRRRRRRRPSGPKPA